MVRGIAERRRSRNEQRDERRRLHDKLVIDARAFYSDVRRQVIAIADASKRFGSQADQVLVRRDDDTALVLVRSAGSNKVSWTLLHYQPATYPHQPQLTCEYSWDDEHGEPRSDTKVLDLIRGDDGCIQASPSGVNPSATARLMLETWLDKS